MLVFDGYSIESLMSSFSLFRYNKDSSTPRNIVESVTSYYSRATKDYNAWSSGMQMHFGYWRRGINPFCREQMLKELNRQAFSRLKIPSLKSARLADLGGGVGATARDAVDLYERLIVDVVTIVPEQIIIASSMNKSAIRGNNIILYCEDFVNTTIASDSCDAVCMIESACHAEGNTKKNLLTEAFRILKPGGRLIMIDGMLKKDISQTSFLGSLRKKIYDIWRESWAISELCRYDLVSETMKEIGYFEIYKEDWSLRVIPSVSHIPFLTLKYLVKESLHSRSIFSDWRWKHLVGSILTPAIGLQRDLFLYAAITARKPEHSC